MATLILTHPACLEHDAGPGHPERPQRLLAIMEALAEDEFAALTRREAPRADRELLRLAHPESHIDHVLGSVPASGYRALDGDTVLSPGSGEAALRAAGAVAAAVDAVMAGDFVNAFCAVRPPGHHAEPGRAMGFCLFNNIAIGALHARVRHGLARVAVVDFDVHHGNGTQAIFERDPSLFYGSSHQSPLYPGTGAQSERGVGNIVNVPLRAHTESAGFRQAVASQLLPALESFAPDMILISAGFDAHTDDPLAALDLVEADYFWITAELVGLARRLCRGRIVSALEGGYHLPALAASVAAHIRALMAA